MKDKTKCKRCGINLCNWCDDHERRVCTFCMDPEHRLLWRERIEELRLTGVTEESVKP